MIDKNYILKESLELYLKYGIKSVSIDDLAFKLGVSKKTLYNHITNKDELIKEVIENLVFSLNNGIKKRLYDKREVFDSLLSAYEYILKKFNTVNPSFIYDLKKYYSSHYNQLIQFRDEELASLIIDIINQGIEEKLFRNDLPAECLFRVQMNKVSIMVNDPSFFNETPKSLKMFFNLLINDIRGITTLKGHELLDSVCLSNNSFEFINA
jgi:AcrR family transcriptional regulator